MAVGQHLFEQFASNTTGEKARSLLKICTKLNISRKKVHKILKGECYEKGSAVAKWKSLTPQKRSAAKVAKMAPPAPSDLQTLTSLDYPRSFSGPPHPPKVKYP